MTRRLKSNNPGARLVLRNDDLLIAAVMPQSLNVHTIKVIVTDRGELEFAEWKTGEFGIFDQFTKTIDSIELVSLKSAISELARCEARIPFDSIDCDYAEYETSDRSHLRFWRNNKEVGTSVPSPSFFLDFGIEQDVKTDFESAFETAMNVIRSYCDDRF